MSANTENISLGQKLRQMRESAGISLRELAREVNVSAPFLSDVELGRRFPKDETLLLIAKKLGVSLRVLKEHDTRSALADLKRMADGTPTLGFAFREMVGQVRSGKLSPGDLAEQLRKLYGPKGK
jgi:transcriptional regulator with XRE-family HTH domain